MSVIDVVATCRTIVDHFKHLSVAYGYFRFIQEHSGVPQHCLQEDVHTRWNSSLYMVKSVIEQEVSLAAYAMATSITSYTVTYPTGLSRKVVATLLPIEELAKSISADCTSVSLLIPLVKMLSETCKSTTILV